MPIFQQSILKNYTQDENLIAPRWAAYQNFLAKKEAIKDFKEEEYQEGFLKDIFEACLGYTLKTANPQNYNLERETKNENDGKKADGAIYVDGKVTGVIELKDQKTKNLDKASDQAFGYLNKNSHAKYVIVSNFNELRFYVEKATAYEQFFLFELDYDGFKKLHTILSFESIAKELPHALRERSLTFEQDISNQLYKDYTAFRTKLFENILANNSHADKLELLNATQKLIDRIVFILFGEDTDLLPKQTIPTIIQRQKEVKKLVKNFTLYDSYKVYFEAINAGDADLDITMYNGGLFAHDEFLDALIIDDEVLDARAKILSAYNFGSDISVNILGHIFENSISELEEISAQLLESDFDKKQSKRKKDGVFYTPAYITEYIVQNTLGTLCEAKREELNITEIEAIANPKKPTKKEQERKENLLAYKEWLLNLKILDPACGSGAFLNQALEYLLKEHIRLQNDLALMGDLFASYEVEKEVLEHNLYGVDINEGAVEIARLSLWLRTAKRGRPLTNLSDKIICANSLLHMPFGENSFDVVIGNPPYGAKLQNDEQKHYEIESKESAILFMLLSYKLLKPQGLHSFIIPKPFIFSSTWEKIRAKLKDDIYAIVDCAKVWEEVKLEQIIYSLQKDVSSGSYENLLLKNSEFLHIAHIDKYLCDEFGFFVNGVMQIEIEIGLKMRQIKTSLLDLASESNRGGMFQKEVKNSGDLKVLGGINIQRCELRDVKGFVNKTTELTQNSYLRENSVIVQEIIAHIQNPTDHIKITGTILENISGYSIIDTVQQISLHQEISNRYVLALIHSNLINWYVYRFIFAKAIRTMHLSNQIIKRIPVPNISHAKQEPFIQLVDEILESKQKIKDYKTLLDEAIKTDNFAREIKLKKELDLLESRVLACENEIDAMVYKLYDLTDEEIKIVEGK